MDPTKVELNKDNLKALEKSISDKRGGLLKIIENNKISVYSLILFARLYKIPQTEKISDFEDTLKKYIKDREEIDANGNFELIGKELPADAFELLQEKFGDEKFKRAFIKNIKAKKISINLLLLCMKVLGIKFNNTDNITDVLNKVSDAIGKKKSLSPKKKSLSPKKKSSSPKKKSSSPKKKSSSPKKKSSSPKKKSSSPKKKSPEKKPLPKVDYKKYCKERYLSDNCDDLSEKELKEIITKYKKSCWNPDVKNPCKDGDYCDLNSGNCTPLIRDDEYKLKTEGKTIIGNENDLKRVLKLLNKKGIASSPIKIQGGDKKVMFNLGKKEISPPKEKKKKSSSPKKKSPEKKKFPPKKIIFEEEEKEIKKKAPSKGKEDSKQILSDKAQRDFNALSKEFSECLKNMK